MKEFRTQLEEQVEAKALEVETQKKKVRESGYVHIYLLTFVVGI